MNRRNAGTNLRIRRATAVLLLALTTLSPVRFDHATSQASIEGPTTTTAAITSIAGGRYHFEAGALVAAMVSSAPGEASVLPFSGPTVSSLEILREERFELADADARSIAQLAAPSCQQFSPPLDYTEPVAELMSRDGFAPAPVLNACCRICSTGQACGDTCISRLLTCRTYGGCACDAVYVPPPPPPPPAPVTVLASQQSPWPTVPVGQAVTLTLTLDVSAPFPVYDGDLELRAIDLSTLDTGLRGWDGTGLLAKNVGSKTIAGRHTFSPIIQALAPGAHNLRVDVYHVRQGRLGSGGIYWTFNVTAIPSVARLYEGGHSRWVAQSAYPTMAPGQVAEFWIRFANVGTDPWVRGIWGQQVNLALNGDNKEPFRLGMAVNWLWDDRIATTSTLTVNAGEVAEFRFSVRAPIAAGAYSLNLRPVIDGTSWLEDEGVFWTIVVR